MDNNQNINVEQNNTTTPEPVVEQPVPTEPVQPVVDPSFVPNQEPMVAETTVVNPAPVVNKKNNTKKIIIIVVIIIVAIILAGVAFVLGYFDFNKTSSNSIEPTTNTVESETTTVQTITTKESKTYANKVDIYKSSNKGYDEYYYKNELKNETYYREPGSNRTYVTTIYCRVAKCVVDYRSFKDGIIVSDGYSKPYTIYDKNSNILVEDLFAKEIEEGNSVSPTIAGYTKNNRPYVIFEISKGQWQEENAKSVIIFLDDLSTVNYDGRINYRRNYDGDCYDEVIIKETNLLYVVNGDKIDLYDIDTNKLKFTLNEKDLYLVSYSNYYYLFNELNTLYNLNGQKVLEADKGIYITKDAVYSLEQSTLFKRDLGLKVKYEATGISEVVNIYDATVVLKGNNIVALTEDLKDKDVIFENYNQSANGEIKYVSYDKKTNIYHIMFSKGRSNECEITDQYQYDANTKTLITDGLNMPVNCE